MRLMRGLMRRPCPMVASGACYWCGNRIYEGGYLGDERVMHHPACPWIEVLDYKQTEMFDG